MKSIRSIFVVSLILVSAISARAQVTVDNTITVQSLVEDFFLGEGILVSNITFNGLPADSAFIQVGLMQGTSNVIEFDEGLVLGTADVITSIGQPGMIIPQTENSGSGFGDPDLEDITGNNINDAAILEFDFVVVGDSINFKYVFSSNEYNDYVCSGFNDAFGFFLSGPGISGPYEDNAINLALIPDSDIPVAINTVNPGVAGIFGDPQTCADANENWVEDSQYFVTNLSPSSGDVVVNGLTQTFIAAANVEPCETYHIKMAIGDVVDGALDSFVFLESGSFEIAGELEVNLTPTIGGSPVTTPGFEDVLIPGCSTIEITISKPNCLPADTAFIAYGGTAVQGEDYEFLNQEDSITFFPADVDAITIEFDILYDGTPGENEVLEIFVIWVNLFGVLDTVTASIPYIDPYSISSETNDIVVTCPADSVVVTAEGIGGIDPWLYDWNEEGIGQSVWVDIPPEEQYFYVNISDACAFETILDSVLVVNNIPPPLQVSIDGFVQPECPNQPMNINATVVDGNPSYIYQWSDSRGGSYQSQPGIVVGNVNPNILGFTPEVDVFVTIIDECGTEVSDETQIVYPLYDSLAVVFGPLTDNCPDEPVELDADVVGGAGDYSYAWSIDEGEGTFAEGANPQAEITFVEPAGGFNTFSVITQDKCNRAGQDMVIGSSPDGDILFSGRAEYDVRLPIIKLDRLPNVITPNGDGFNDYFVIQGIEVFDDSRVEVFDRWGRQIYETDNYMAGSEIVKPDDAFDAADQEDGTYFYTVNIDSGECTASGTIQVLGSND